MQDPLARLKQANEKMRKRLAVTRQLGLRGSALKRFEVDCLTSVALNDQGQIRSIRGQDGQEYSAEVWLQRARQGQEGESIQAILATNDSESEVSQPHVGVDELSTLSPEQLRAIAQGNIAVTISVLPNANAG